MEPTNQPSQQPVVNQSEQPKEELKIQSEEGLVKSFDDQGGSMRPKNMKIVLATFVVVILGVLTGYGLNMRSGGGISLGGGGSATEGGGSAKKGVIVGSADKETFKDEAEGKLVKGGIDGEGSHHLERPGGESQNVYLTSSLIDLDLYADRKVRVWGETFAAQQAGWLMDVGRLEVLD